MSMHGQHAQLHSRLGIELGDASSLRIAGAIVALTADRNTCAINSEEVLDLLQVCTEASLDIRSVEPVFDYKLRLVVLHPNGVGGDVQLYYNKAGVCTKAEPVSGVSRLTPEVCSLVADAMDRFQEGRVGRLAKGHLFALSKPASAVVVDGAQEQLATLLDVCRSLSSPHMNLDDLACRSGLERRVSEVDDFIAGLQGVRNLSDREPGAAPWMGERSSQASMVGWWGEEKIFDYHLRRMRQRWPDAQEQDLSLGVVFKNAGTIVGEIYWPDRIWGGEQQRISVSGFDMIEWGIDGGPDDIRLHEVKATEKSSQASILRNRVTSRQRCLALAVGPSQYHIWSVYGVNGSRGGVFHSVDWTPEKMRQHLKNSIDGEAY